MVLRPRYRSSAATAATVTTINRHADSSCIARAILRLHPQRQTWQRVGADADRRHGGDSELVHAAHAQAIHTCFAFAVARASYDDPIAKDGGPDLRSARAAKRVVATAQRLTARMCSTTPTSCAMTV